MKEFFKGNPVWFTTGGGVKERRQDTIANFHHAISLGSDVIRTNVDLTADGKLIAFSDEAALWLRSQRQSDSSLSAADISREYRAYLENSRQPDATLQFHDIDGLFPEVRELLDEFPSQRFNFTLSGGDPNIAARLHDTIGSADEWRILISSWRAKTIKNVRDLGSAMACSFSLSGFVGIYALYKTGCMFAKKKFTHDALIIPEVVGVSYIANRQLVRQLHEKEVRVYILGVETREQVNRLRDAGVDGFITGNLPACL